MKREGAAPVSSTSWRVATQNGIRITRLFIMDIYYCYYIRDIYLYLCITKLFIKAIYYYPLDVYVRERFGSACRGDRVRRARESRARFFIRKDRGRQPNICASTEITHFGSIANIGPVSVPNAYSCIRKSGLTPVPANPSERKPRLFLKCGGVPTERRNARAHCLLPTTNQPG